METRKGFLVNKNVQDKYYFDISVCNGVICDYSKEFYDFYQSISKDEREALDNFFKDYNGSEIDDTKIKEILLRFCKDKIALKNHLIPIIYEERVDINGNKYGIEYLTDYPFPIPKSLSGDFNLFRVKEISNVYQGVKTNVSNPSKSVIYYACGKDSKQYLIFKNRTGRKFYTNNRDDYKIYSLFDNYDDSCHANEVNPTLGIKKTELNRYRICMSIDYVHDNMNRMDVALIENGFANQNDIDKYEKRNYINNGIISKVRKSYNLNAFKDEDLLSKVEEKKNNSNLLDLMNKIEAQLLMIKDINDILFKDLNEKYHNIIGSNTYRGKGKEEELQIFYNSINNISFLPEYTRQIVDLLDKYTNRIMNDINNDVYPKIYLQALTKMHDDLINIENKHPLPDVKAINDRINFLYFLFLYTNKEQYMIQEDKSYTETPFYKEISSSYIGDNIVGIINIIQRMIESGVINNNQELIYHANCFYKPESTTLANLLDLVRETKINEINKAKELIK